ncbi:MAG: FAD-dependent oxidoreductase [Thermodesulfobacteriota bacterium]
MNSINQKVLILGGGIAGITAALALGRLHIPVVLIEKSEVLGGMVRNFCCKATDACQQCGACLLNDSLAALGKDPIVEIHLQTELTAIKMEAKEFLYTYSRPGGGGEGRAAALLLATGFTPFRAEDKPQYRYKILPNVLTGLDLERELKETGTILRPSDQTLPKSIAFIQCVGSRDLHLKHPFCSQVCCGYALRMANLIKHKNPEMEITVFYMDIQTFGKDFPLFMEQSRKQISFVRSIPGEIQKGENDQVLLTFQKETGAGSQKEAFDLAVLSVGIMPGPDNSFLVQRLGLSIGPDGFLSEGAGPSDRLEGIFLAGTVQGPRSIEGSIAQAYRAAEEVAAYLKTRPAP